MQGAGLMARPNALEQLIASWEPKLRKAFLDGVYALRDRSQVELLVEMLRRGDVEGALRAVGLDAVAFRDLDATIAEAYESGGRFATDGIPPARQPGGFKLTVDFDVRNPRAETWLRDHSATLVRDIVADQQAAIRQHLVAGMERGENPRTTALDLVGRINRETGRRDGGVIGLTASQEQWVRSFGDRVASADPDDLRAALDMKLRDRRFDRALMRAIRDGKPIPAATRDAMVAAYRSRALRYRAEAIGRTEAMTALNESAIEGTRQAIDRGVLQRSAVSLIWRTAADERVRGTHRAMNGQRVQWGETFVSPSGARLRYPGDPAAPAAERINCRCHVETKVDFLAEAVGAPPPGPQSPAGGISGPSPAWLWKPLRREEHFDLTVRPGATAFGLFANDEEARLLASELMAGIPAGAEVKAAWGGDASSLWFSANGPGVKLSRMFQRRGQFVTVEHSYFALSRDYQGGGHARRMMQASLHAYDRLGIDRAEVHANIDVGGYSWARVGFTPTAASLDEMRTAIEDAAEELEGSRRRQVLELLAVSDDLRLMYDLARIRDAAGPYGKQLLLNSDWFGYIDLKDPDHRALVNEALAP